jgi:DNA-binding response OmpR family regulator
MGKSPLILVVQGAGRNRLTNMLERNGFAVSLARNGRQAVAQAKESQPVLAVIDPSSLRINGTRLCSMLKRAVDSIPVISVADEDVAIVEDGVVDLFLQRPLTTRKLLNRLRKLLPPEDTDILSVSDIVFDVEKREVQKGVHRFRLTPKQATLLEALMREPGKVLSRRFLMKHVWNTDYLGDTRTLDVHIRWVREAIEDDPSNPMYLRTVRGVGYRFDVPGQEAASATD